LTREKLRYIIESPYVGGIESCVQGGDFHTRINASIQIVLLVPDTAVSSTAEGTTEGETDRYLRRHRFSDTFYLRLQELIPSRFECGSDKERHNKSQSGMYRGLNYFTPKFNT
jgi:hypothetical protein